MQYHKSTTPDSPNTRRKLLEEWKKTKKASPSNSPVKKVLNISNKNFDPNI